MIKKILIGLAVIFVILQFFRIDMENPASDPSSDFIVQEKVPEDIAKLLTSACYDCHSHKTVYPWYAHVAPVSWMVGHDIEEGREHLNLSKWNDYSKDKRKHLLDEMYEEVEEGEMPLSGYKLTHSDADLNQEQTELLVHWLEEREESY